MSNPVNSTGPGNDPFAGGTYAPTGNPVQVGGTFGGPGSGGFPNPGQPPILSARNNSGSNVRIPYARCAALPCFSCLRPLPMRIEGCHFRPCMLLFRPQACAHAQPRYTPR